MRSSSSGDAGGPSPRRRGALPAPLLRARRRGAIPAQAGSTEDPRAGPVTPRGHPRAGGEHVFPVPGVEFDAGPSPRRRGARDRRYLRRRGVRAIPAQAGSTRPSSPSRSCTRGHPRAGGEHLPAQEHPGRGQGPSPRRRGARTDTGRARARGGAIPAQAGSTSRPRSCARWAWGHPRAGGEHVGGGAVADVERGPSPRRRGARARRDPRLRQRGAIPAQAGSTGQGRRRTGRTGGHPRAGGEHVATSLTRVSRAGPSPRRRGAHGGADAGVPVGGAIPAQAGSTRSSLRIRLVHRGAIPAQAGSTALSGNAMMSELGAIPAQAGSTPPDAAGQPRIRAIPAQAGSTDDYTRRVTAVWGPSPRRRGAQILVVDRLDASAGHPRAGGEHHV